MGLGLRIDMKLLANPGPNLGADIVEGKRERLARWEDRYIAARGRLRGECSTTCVWTHVRHLGGAGAVPGVTGELDGPHAHEAALDVRGVMPTEVEGAQELDERLYGCGMPFEELLQRQRRRQEQQQVEAAEQVEEAEWQLAAEAMEAAEEEGGEEREAGERL